MAGRRAAESGRGQRQVVALLDLPQLRLVAYGLEQLGALERARAGEPRHAAVQRVERLGHLPVEVNALHQLRLDLREGRGGGAQ
jgi:hypothetical protein